MMAWRSSGTFSATGSGAAAPFTYQWRTQPTSTWGMFSTVAT